jgi:hypothetical protein
MSGVGALVDQPAQVSSSGKSGDKLVHDSQTPLNRPRPLRTYPEGYGDGAGNQQSTKDEHER